MGRRSRAQAAAAAARDTRAVRGSGRASGHDGSGLHDSGHDGGPQGGFPLLVAALSTATALALFFSATVPAMQEQRLLRQVETERRHLRQDLWHALDADAGARAALAVDVQSLLLELDRRGVYPGDLLEPPPAVADGGREDPRPDGGAIGGATGGANGGATGGTIGGTIGGANGGRRLR